MALFKILKGQASNLGKESIRNGYCYVTLDNHKMYIDHIDTDNDGKEIPNSGTRFCLNAEVADRLSTARTITLSGDASGSVNFDGSQDINLVVDIEELDNIKEAIEVLETKKPDLEEVNEQIQNLNNKFEEYLPLTAGPDKKINGPLGLTAEVMYGPELPLEENSFEGQLFFLEEDSFALPNGGRAGQVLAKNSNRDGDAIWIDTNNGVSLPDGGTTGQVLIKNSNKNGDTIWADINAETLNGKTEEMLSVARAVEATNTVNAINAENSNTLGGKVESELSVANANNANTLGGKVENELSVANAVNANNATNANTLGGKVESELSVANAVNAENSNTLGGKPENMLSVANAANANNANTLGGKVENELSVANAVNANNANTLGGYSINSLLNKIYPVGSIYMSVNSTSPATLFGGTWSQLKDRFLLAAGSTYSAGATGGAATHTLTANEMPSHNHGSKSLTGKVGGVLFDDGLTMTSSGILSYSTARERSWSGATGSASKYISVDATHTHSSNGGGAAHNNMPPYLAVYMWKRTA